MEPSFDSVYTLSMRKQSYGKKLLYVGAFILSAVIMFIATAPLADCVKTLDDKINNVFVQAICALPIFLLVSVFEGRLIWKLDRQTEFTTVFPISLGVFIGYAMHFAVKL